MMMMINFENNCDRDGGKNRIASCRRDRKDEGRWEIILSSNAKLEERGKGKKID